jgi:hypothetical protein
VLAAKFIATEGATSMDPPAQTPKP